MTGHITLSFDGRVYKINPGFDTVCEIEDELGGIAELFEHFSKNTWKVSEVVILVQILLQSKGRTVDYILLGNQMLKDGLESYLSSIKEFLKLIVK